MQLKIMDTAKVTLGTALLAIPRTRERKILQASGRRSVQYNGHESNGDVRVLELFSERKTIRTVFTNNSR